MFIERKFDLDIVRNRINHNPVTAIIGPRQSGKTTLAMMLKPDKLFDLENPVDFAALENPLLQLSNQKGLIVIDEVQHKPELFPVLRYICDTNPEVRFCILGSASQNVIQKSSESLAGRISYYILMGFRKDDLPPEVASHFFIRGGFPRSLLAVDDTVSNQWRKDYIKTFLERDIPQLGIRIPAYTLFRFWQMVAHYHANVINFSELGRSLSCADTTIRRYIDILFGTYMVRLLQPWYHNVGKRIVKRPKLYIRDSGIFNALMGIESEDDLMRHPKLGAAWEGFALEAVCRALHKRDEELFFYSVHSGAELDLVWQHKGKLWGCEFKYADAPVLTKSMHIAKNDLQLEKLWVVYPGKKRYLLAEDIEALPFDEIPPEWLY